MKHFIVAAALLAFAAAGCEDEPEVIVVEDPAIETDSALPAPAMFACVTCPGSMELPVEDNTPSAEFAGKTYHFCCGGCKSTFEEDPTQFVTADEEAPSTRPAGA
jgi:YHS domain-containing protein